MSKADIKAREIILRVNRGESPESVKIALCKNDDEWYKWSIKAYAINLAEEKKERAAILARPHTAGASSAEIDALLLLNDKLADYALSLSVFSTMGDFKYISKLADELPASENNIIGSIGRLTMHPKNRVMQKIGRIEKFPHFNLFTKIIDAATISYYRTNFIGCYLTLLPVIEGIIIRWMGYTGASTKPEFEDIRKFFKNSHKRQPCPTNISFHNVYVKACEKILNQHFYKPTLAGDAYANFNRHVASHILNDEDFASKENCIRLFILLDTMTEIYLTETREPDPRFFLSTEKIGPQTEIFANLMLDNTQPSAEHKILGTNAIDLLYGGIAKETK